VLPKEHIHFSNLISSTVSSGVMVSCFVGLLVSSMSSVSWLIGSWLLFLVCLFSGVFNVMSICCALVCCMIGLLDCGFFNLTSYLVHVFIGLSVSSRLLVSWYIGFLVSSMSSISWLNCFFKFLGFSMLWFLQGPRLGFFKVLGNCELRSLRTNHIHGHSAWTQAVIICWLDTC